ncbi:MAG TPA: RNA-binding S4 domain-containing protein [Kofleriaceae bacterium]|nr:RNA-binding S4 domain-containing protein [Kofleriaceae bacterium]
MDGGADKRVRLDKWLWAARFYKTRSQSAAAIKAGKVELDGTRAKVSQKIGPGARIEVRKGPYAFTVEVRDVAERRGSAERAQALYAEDPDSIARREQARARIAAERTAIPRGWGGRGRPTKKQRRDLEAFQARLFSPEDIDDDLDHDLDVDNEAP